MPMRTSRDSLFRSAVSIGKLCLTVGAGLAASQALAQSAGDGKTKYVYKAVPCTPCPCECPDARAVRETPYSTPAQSAPSPAPAAFAAEPAAAHPAAHSPAPAAPSPAAAVAAPAAAKPVDPGRGSIGGSVLVRDRNGAEKADRSDVVIYLEQVPRKYQALKKPRAMAQRDKAFAPKLIAVTRGSTVDFPNEDKFFHNVFSLSEGSTFDLGLYRAGESKSVTFDKTGVVDVYCNIHPNMWAQILVLENPFFTTSVKDGSFELAKVPAGSYTVDAWISGGAEPVRQQIKVEPGKRVDLKLEIREGAANKQHLNKNNQPYGRYK
jgi:plastocyanin